MHRIFKALAVMSAAALLSAVPLTASASTGAGYTDTSVQTSYFTPSSCSAFSAASVSSPTPSSSLTFSETGYGLSNATIGNPAAGSFNAYVAVNGPGSVTITSEGLDGSGGSATLTFSITYGGCTEVESVLVSEDYGGDLSSSSQSVEFVSSVSLYDYNANGTVVGSGDSINVANYVTVTYSNLPAGLTQSGNTLYPGTAVPGVYTSDFTATDSDGASISGEFRLRVNGSRARTVHTTGAQAGTVVGFGDNCLDVTGAFGTGAAGDVLQMWSCGAPGTTAGTEDQEFNYISGELEYASSGLCVSSISMNSRSVLEICGSSGTSVTFRHGAYEFGNNGSVLDVAGFGHSDGTHVLTWAANRGANQDEWSLPR